MAILADVILPCPSHGGAGLRITLDSPSNHFLHIVCDNCDLDYQDELVMIEYEEFAEYSSPLGTFDLVGTKNRLRVCLSWAQVFGTPDGMLVAGGTFMTGTGPSSFKILIRQIAMPPLP